MDSFVVPDGLVVFTGNNCQACKDLKRDLTSKGLSYLEFNIHDNDEALDFLLSQGLRGIPQVFNNKVWIGRGAV